MSIELTGPKAYDRQYRLSLLLALNTLDGSSPKSVVVEAPDGEDAQLTLPDGRILEVQVKTDTADIDWVAIAGVLTHFESHKADACTLSRLAADPKRSLLFVGGGRATDALRCFLRRRPDHSLPSPQKLPDASRTALAAALRATSAKGSSALDKKRHATCQQLATALDGGDQGLLAALDRTIIWEQTDDTAVTADIGTFLFTHSHVPSVSAGVITSALTDEVRLARDRRGDCLPGINKVLADFRNSRMRHGSFHLDRGDEAALEALLLRYYHLALAGHSKCGKSHLAQELLIRLQGQGWRCEIFPDIDQAARYLQSNDAQPRACLIDDPLWDRTQSRPLNQLRNLRDWCRRDRLALVTSSTETLRQIMPSFCFGSSGPAGLIWQDCTVTDRDYLGKLWRAFCQEEGADVPATVVTLIIRLVDSMAAADLLQPGQLHHLARRPKTELTGRTMDELIGIARFTNESMLVELNVDRDTALAAAVLALACDTLRGARKQDLAFIASRSEVRPAHFETHGILPYKLNQQGFPQFPTYPAEIPALNFGPILAEWERRGYLRHTAEQWSFAHPDYREAFTQLALAELRRSPEIRLHAERALAALAPQVCLAAARIFARLWRENDTEITAWAWTQLHRAFGESIFPSVREEVLSTLLNSRQRISGDALNSLLRLAHLEFPGDSRLIWEKDIPWICRGTDAGYAERMELLHRLPELAVFADQCRRIADPAFSAAVTEREIDQLICYLIRHDTLPLEVPVLQRAGRSVHSFIRASVAELLCCGRLPFGEDAKRSLDDSDARVTAHAIKVLIESWPQHHTAGHTTDVTAAINSSLQSLPVAVMVTRVLFDFGDLHSERISIRWDILTQLQAKDLWSSWATWMGTVFSVIAPYPFDFKDGDLWTSFKAGPQHLSATKFQAVVEAWIDFIEGRSLVSGLSDYTYGVSDILFEPSSPLSAAQREHLLGRVLQLRATDPVIDNLGTMIELWTRLTKTEKTSVSSLLSSQRGDLLWLRAAVLVRDCPRALQPLAGNRKDFYKQTPDEVILALPRDLLRCVLAMYVRYTPGSASLRVRHRARFWSAIAHQVLFDWNHPDQPSLIFHHLLRFDDERNRKPLVTICDALCQAASPAGRRLLFQMLCSTGDYAPHVRLHEFGTALFNVCTEAEREEFMGKFAADINLIEENSRTLIEFWGREWCGLLLKCLPNDNHMLTMLSVFRDLDAAELQEYEKLLGFFYQHMKPIMRLSHENLIGILKRAGLQSLPVYQLAEQARSATFDYERQKGYGRAPKTFRDGWIH